MAPYLDGLEGALAAATLRQDGLAGAVRLGGPAEFMAEKVLPGLGGLSELGIRLEVKLGIAQELIKHLDAGTLDLAIATVRIPRKSVAYQPVYREGFVLVGAPKWAAIAPPRIVRSEEHTSELQSQR